MLRFVLGALALVFSTVAFLLSIWIILPAPLYRLWHVAVGASEWSLWLGLLGLLGAGLSVGALATGSRWIAWLSFALGVAAIVMAAVPPLQSAPIAHANNVQLSLVHYFGAFRTQTQSITPSTVTYATVEGQPLKLDVFSRGETAELRPAMIVVHGGSWSGGDKTDFPRWDQWLAEQGFAVFDIQYRLAPQPNWQTATADVKCAIGWVKRNAAQYGVDAQRIAIMGRSAGGHLALLAAYTPGNPSLPASCEAPDTSVRAVISLYGPADLVWGYNNPANPDVIDGPGTLRRFLGGTPETATEAFQIASPITHVGPNTPPTLLFHGGRDQLVGQRHAELLSEQLTAASVPHHPVFIPYGQHGFDYNFYGWGSQIMKPVLLDFLQTHLAT